MFVPTVRMYHKTTSKNGRRRDVHLEKIRQKSIKKTTYTLATFVLA